MSFELVPLGDLGDIVSGSTPDTTNKSYWGGDISWITPADLTDHEGVYFTGNLRKITEAGYKSCSTKMLPAGSILFSSRAPIGHCAVTSFPLCTNQGFKSIIPNERLDPVYGFFALKFFKPQIKAIGRGATFAEVNKELFENFRIPLPPLAEQERIADLLSRADRLRRLRRYARRLGDTYLQSVFVEMFGDPIKSNPQGKKICELREICSRITDGTHQPPKWAESGIPFIFVSNIVDGKIMFDTRKFISDETWRELQKRCPIEINDILYTIVGSYGNAALVETVRRFSFQRHIAHVKPNVIKIQPEFLLGMMQSFSFREQVERQVRGVAQKTLNLKELQEIKVFVPPCNEQEKYITLRRVYERLRTQQAESERQAEGLFQSLLHEAFSQG